MPAVRQSIDEQNTAARAAGRPAVASDAILKIAEELLPTLKLAEWKDRATSAQAAGANYAYESCGQSSRRRGPSHSTMRRAHSPGRCKSRSTIG